MLSTHTDDNTYIYVCYPLCVYVMLSTCVYVCECVYIFLSVCVEVCIPPTPWVIYLYCHRQKFLTEITFSVDKSNFYVTILFMNTRQVRISVGAYERLLELKEETGLSLTKLIDESVIHYSTGKHFDKLSDVVKLARSKEGFIEALEEVFNKIKKGDK